MHLFPGRICSVFFKSLEKQKAWIWRGLKFGYLMWRAGSNGDELSLEHKYLLYGGDREPLLQLSGWAGEERSMTQPPTNSENAEAIRPSETLGSGGGHFQGPTPAHFSLYPPCTCPHGFPLQHGAQLRITHACICLMISFMVTLLPRPTAGQAGVCCLPPVCPIFSKSHYNTGQAHTA